MNNQSSDKRPSGPPWWAWLAEFLIVFYYVIEPAATHFIG